MRLKDKVTIVTGAAKGLGKGILHWYGKRGGKDHGSHPKGYCQFGEDGKGD